MPQVKNSVCAIPQEESIELSFNHFRYLLDYLFYRVTKCTNGVNRNFHNISGTKEFWRAKTHSDTFRCSSGDDITWKQCHAGRKSRNQFSNRKD